MKVKSQGIFKEMLQGSASDPSIFDFIQSEANEDENKIIDYLENGTVIIACAGVMVDVVNPENGLAGSPEWKTDGIWAWSGELAYYVKQYHLKLNDEFIETMRKNAWTIRRDLEINVDNIEIV